MIISHAKTRSTDDPRTRKRCICNFSWDTVIFMSHYGGWTPVYKMMGSCHLHTKRQWTMVNRWVVEYWRWVQYRQKSTSSWGDVTTRPVYQATHYRTIIVPYINYIMIIEYGDRSTHSITLAYLSIGSLQLISFWSVLNTPSGIKNLFPELIGSEKITHLLGLYAFFSQRSNSSRDDYIYERFFII